MSKKGPDEALEALAATRRHLFGLRASLTETVDEAMRHIAQIEQRLAGAAATMTARPKRQRGFTLLGLAAMAVVLGALAAGAVFLKGEHDRLRADPAPGESIFRLNGRNIYTTTKDYEWGWCHYAMIYHRPGRGLDVECFAHPQPTTKEPPP